MKKISVVIATYNGEEYIEKQLKSILNQNCKPDEIIICDDNSTDKTVNIIRDIMKISDITIRVSINKWNVGYIQNFRDAILKASGEIIFLCDQDDIWYQNKISKTLSLMDEYDASIVCTGFRLIDGFDSPIENLVKYKSDPISGYENWTNDVFLILPERLIWGNFCPGCTYCFSIDVLDIFKKISNKELSHDFQLLLIGANKGKAIYIDEPLSCYRLHENNTIGMNNKEKKRKRHFKPRVTRFLNELSNIEIVKHLFFLNIVLYLRLPKFRFELIKKFKLRNRINLKRIKNI